MGLECVWYALSTHAPNLQRHKKLFSRRLAHNWSAHLLIRPVGCRCLLSSYTSSVHTAYMQPVGAVHLPMHQSIIMFFYTLSKAFNSVIKEYCADIIITVLPSFSQSWNSQEKS